MGGDFFNGAVRVLGVALVWMGLLESLSKIIVLIWSGRVELKGDGFLSGEIGIDKRVKSRL